MKSVLFVDDHQILARLSCEILEMRGYRAISAYDAEDALRKCEQDDFDVIVTDYRMEGMNGVELAQRVHEKHPETPVILVTGYGPIDGGKDVVACLEKEELFPALLEKIEMVLRVDEKELEAVKMA
jgi:DNA-binding NtrC family response regulator